MFLGGIRGVLYALTKPQVVERTTTSDRELTGISKFPIPGHLRPRSMTEQKLDPLARGDDEPPAVVVAR